MGRIDELAKQYVEAESRRRERTVGTKLTDYEKDLVVETFKYAYLQAVRSAESLAIYSEKGIVERIKELRR